MKYSLKYQLSSTSVVVIVAIFLLVFNASAQSIRTDLANLKESLPNLVRAYDKISIFDAWDVINKNKPTLATITVGIIDTGIDASDGSHPEFEGVNFGRSSPFSLRDRAVEFRNDLTFGHGTEVAGVIGANNISITQTLPSGSMQMNGIISGVSSQYILESRTAYLIDSLVLGGIVDRMPSGSIINISYKLIDCRIFLGICVKGEDFDQTTEYFRQIFTKNPDKTFIIAAGNDGINVNNSIPSNINLDNSIIVAASNLDDKRASIANNNNFNSNFGVGVNISAPGVEVYTPAIRDKGNFPASGSEMGNYLTYFGGTSASAPMVNGVAGLIKAIKPDLTPAQIKQILIETADPIQTGEPNKRIGTGCYTDPNNPINTGCRLNAYKAVCHPLVLNCAPTEFIIPYANIAIDGNDFDWQGVPSAIQDPVGDKTGTRSGTDISAVYLAHDNAYLYVKINLADGPPNPSWTFYSLYLDSNPTAPQIGDQYLLSHFTGIAWPIYLKQWTSISPPDAITVYQDIAAPGLYFLEMRMPLSKLTEDPFVFYTYSQTDPAAAYYFDRTSKIEVKL